MNTRARITAIPALLAAGVLASLPRALGAAAQESEATFPTAWDGLDLPEIHLEIVANAISGMPAELEAGRYKVNVSAEPTPEDFTLGPMFGGLPDGLTIDDILDQAAAAPDGIPPAFYEIIIPGAPTIYAPNGETSASGIIDLTPGDWFVAGQLLAQPPVPFTVTGELPTELPEPESTVTFSVGEMVVEITAGELMVGENLVKLENLGAQPHFVELMKAPEGTTIDDVASLFEAMMTGTPVPGGLTFADLGPGGFVSDVSSGQTQWATLNLTQPGTHLAICFVADSASGMPHALMGMYAIVEVTA
ncbi:MAG: hypothetical protein KC435_04525 [Thermomicrobiales bacterium]|nr:hypothetical protein [Thermomicrobiales bacterium]